MANITLSLNDNLIKKGREYAKKHHLSLNALVRKLLAERVLQESDNWLESCFLLMDKAEADSKGKKWQRAELYER